jgi:hypothetical protein
MAMAGDTFRAEEERLLAQSKCGILAVLPAACRTATVRCLMPVACCSDA